MLVSLTSSGGLSVSSCCQLHVRRCSGCWVADGAVYPTRAVIVLVLHVKHCSFRVALPIEPVPSWHPLFEERDFVAPFCEEAPEHPSKSSVSAQDPASTLASGAVETSVVEGLSADGSSSGPVVAGGRGQV